jgi:hypothetical protein
MVLRSAREKRARGAGSRDFWLIKTDATGNMLWNKTYGGTGDDMARSLVQTNDGKYALAGTTTSFGAGSEDFWLVKIGGEEGLTWTESTANTLTLYSETAYWNLIRVQIWLRKPP